MTTSLPRSALWYAQHGWGIFPLRPRTKEPFFGLGVYHATTDTDQIADWWLRWPQANIGLHCGGSGILALDLDTYKDTFAGGGILFRGDEETVTNLTGSGGTHLLYQMPEGRKYTNMTGNLPPGIDVRGQGGYIVVPPSIHPNGTPYRWEMGYGPHEIDPIPMPHALRALLDEAGAHQRTAGPPDSYAVKAAMATVANVILRLDLDVRKGDPSTYDGEDGRKWILKICPFQSPENPHKADMGAYITIARDGHIAAGCHHARCRQMLKDAKMGGWRWLLRQATEPAR